MGTERKFIQNIALGTLSPSNDSSSCHVILLHSSFEVFGQSIHEFKSIQVIGSGNPKYKYQNSFGDNTQTNRLSTIVLFQMVRVQRCLDNGSAMNFLDFEPSKLLALRTYFLASPPFVQMAKSLVIFPDSIVLMHTFSKVSANFSNAGLLSIFPR